MIYFDNAATSFPKPQSVIKAVSESFAKYPSNPGRNGYATSIKATEVMYETRSELDSLFNGYGAENVEFTLNCTMALNMAIKGVVRKNDHIIISSLEHNSVLRPIHMLSLEGMCEYSVFEVSDNTEETVNNFINSFRDNTRLCVVTSVSNVFGNILPLKRLSEIAHSKGALFFVDGAQGAGIVTLDMQDMGIDCLCVPGHKGLLGPMGTGAIIHSGVEFIPLISGGTGSRSMSPLQPDEYPDRMESGTVNVPGICGLLAGVRQLKRVGVDKIYEIEREKTDYIANGLNEINGVKVYRNAPSHYYGSVVSFNVNNMHSEAVAGELGRNNIAVRGGYHCSYLAHKFNGTTELGAVRVSPSIFNTKKDINILLNLVRKIAISNFI